MTSAPGRSTRGNANASANAAAVAQAQSAEHGSFNELHALAARSTKAATSVAETGTRTLNTQVTAAQNQLRRLQELRGPGVPINPPGRSADSARFLPEEYDDDPDASWLLR